VRDIRMNDTSFFWHRQIDPRDDTGSIILGYTDVLNSSNNLEAWIVPTHGSNLCRFSMGGKAIIGFDPELLVAGKETGTLVLYPTPNRVRNGVFRSKGMDYPQFKRGKKILEHGLVRTEAWCSGEAQVAADSASVRTWIDFDRSSPLFEAFPFVHRLGLEFCLMQDGVQVSYTVQNKDDKDIPFGFGLHPYFMKLSGDEGTSVVLPANDVMETTPDLLPTGRLIAVDGTPYDLRQEVKIGTLDLDHVFTNIPQGDFASIHYESLGLRVIVEASSDFSHLVLYSPRGQPDFCLESQTCSTDAHNLYERGFHGESGLKFVQASQSHTGAVKYTIKHEV
jgi:aldose 1-epimerase